MPVALPLFAPLEQEALVQIKKLINKCKGLKKQKRLLLSGQARLVAGIDQILQNWKGEPGDATSRNDIAQMRALAQSIEDCLECYLYEPSKCLRNQRFAFEMYQLNKRLENLDEKPLDAKQSVDNRREDHICDSPMGVANAREKLLMLLNTAGSGSGNLMVIAIVGFNGSGKTTLANEVYEQSSKSGFEFRTMINISQYKKTEDLLRNIIHDFWPGAVAETRQLRLQGLKNYIKEQLNGVRYLIIFDDLNDQDHWEGIKTTFHAKAGASRRIIVTTRLQSIANHCMAHADGYVHEMRGVGDKASLVISGLLDYNNLPRKNLLDKCGGHPLALRSIKNYFISREDPAAKIYDNLCKNLGVFLHDGRKDRMDDFSRLRGVLMDNFVCLQDSMARSCMFYLGIFPNGRPIKRSRLTRRWVAEGYAEDQDRFIEFIERNIVQPVGIRRESYKQSKLWNTVSILHEFVLHMSQSHDFIIAIEDQEEYKTASPRIKGEKKTVRHVFVNGSNITSSGNINLSSVRSLTVYKDAGLGGAFSQFKKYKLLRVLDMEECCDEKLSDAHLSDICNLWNLRYFSLGTNITNLPSQFVEKLKYLESLQLSKEEVSELPVQVIGMPMLKYLIGKIKFTYKKENDVRVECRKSILETIAGAEVSAEEKVFLMSMVPNMNKLRKVKIWCTSKGNITDLDTQLFQAIKYYTKCEMQQSLSIDFKGLSQEDMIRLQNQGQHYKFFEKLLEETASNYSYLSSIKLCGTLVSIPKFLAKLSGLVMLCLSLTILKQEHLARLSEVGTLVRLKLVADYIGSNPLEIPVKGFENLEILCFKVKGSDAKDLKVNIIPPTRGTGFGKLPKLVSLQLLCDEMPDPSGIHITQFPVLQEIELHPFIGDARIAWEDEAWKHPKRPNILPLQFFDDKETTASDQPAAGAPGREDMPRMADIGDATATRDQSEDHANGDQERIADDSPTGYV